jgi:hypothetical protein
LPRLNPGCDHGKDTCLLPWSSERTALTTNSKVSESMPVASLSSIVARRLLAAGGVR